MMRFSSVLLLGSMGLLFAGCSTSPTVAVTAQILPLVTVPKPTTTKQATEVATDSQKQVLKVGDISELKDDKTCDDVGETLVYAETKNYFVYICGNAQDTTQPNYFKAKPRNDNNKPSIVGKASLGWQQFSFVGISGDYTYSMSIPSGITHSGNDKPHLYIRPFSLYIQKDPTLPLEVGQYEEFTKYLSVAEYKQSRKLERWWWRSEQDFWLDSQKRKFIKYLIDNRERLKVCEDRARDAKNGREEDSTLYNFDNSRYLLQLRCSVYAKSNSFNFFLISEQNTGIEVKPLIRPEIHINRVRLINYYDGRVVSGRPLYDPKTKNLSIHSQASGLSRGGYLLTFTIKNDQLELIELKSTEKDDNYYIDPIVYPVVYP